MSGENRSGAVISLQALSESLSIALSNQMLGIILQVAGFDGSAAVQTATAQHWIANCFAVIPGLFMILAALLIKKYPIDKTAFERVMKALESKLDIVLDENDKDGWFEILSYHDDAFVENSESVHLVHGINRRVLDPLVFDTEEIKPLNNSLALVNVGAEIRGSCDENGGILLFEFVFAKNGFFLVVENPENCSSAPGHGGA